MCEEIQFIRQSLRKEAARILLETYDKQITESLADIDLSDIGLKWLETDHYTQCETGNDKIHKLPIEEARVFLHVHFKNIRSVEEWAEGMGYSIGYFWRKFYAAIGVPPREAYIEKKKSVLINYLKKNPDCKSMEAAKKIHLADGNSLLQFVKRHFGCRPTDLKERIRKGNI